MAEFVHRYIPTEMGGSSVVLVLLHGAGGDENDLLPLGRRLLASASLLSVRGAHETEDLPGRTHELVEFLQQFHGPFVVVGYSHGASLAASLMILQPGLFVGAILFRPSAPPEPEQPPALEGKPVFLAGGSEDPAVPAESTRKLAQMLESYGAQVTLHWETAGHGLEDAEIEAAQEWARAFAREAD